MHRATSLLIIFLIAITNAIAAPEIRYRLSIEKPHTHYVDVEIEISGIKKPFIDVVMPAWTPGSYLIRDFAKSTESFEAVAGPTSLLVEKIDKSTWRIFTNKKNEIKVRYKVYAFELSVRTSFVDASHAFISPSSVFMYVEGHKNVPVSLVVQPYKEWNEISTSLQTLNNKKWQFIASDYDVLADSPLEIGTHKVWEFTAAGIKHQVAMYGNAEYDKERILADMAKIAEACTAVFGENPIDNYTFIIHNLTRGGGGLEHANSTVLQVGRWAYSTEADYLNFLSLVAHEYFHLWNVKRIRPHELGPFDYKNENYTSLLWFAEGVTSYYDELILRRTSFINVNDYLRRLSKSITSIESQPGKSVQSLSASSFDAWIKAYKPNENSPNTTISYYSKGSVIAALLDIEVIHSTNGDKNLDDVLKYIYKEYYKKNNTGVTEADIKEAFATVTGKKMDDFFDKYINSTEDVDYKTIFGQAGIEVLTSKINESTPQFGATLSDKDGKLMVNNILRGSAAHEAGINVNDEIVAVDNYRVHSSLFNKIIENREPGSEVKVIISRDGMLQELNVNLKKSDVVAFTLIRSGNRTEKQEKVFKKWLDAEDNKF